MLKFGLDKLLQSEDSSIDNVDLQSILGATVDGEWSLPEEAEIENKKADEEEQMELDEDTQQGRIVTKSRDLQAVNMS